MIGKWENSRFCLYELNTDYFQAHLERIPEYLKEGEWWHFEEDSNEIVFHDGDGEPEYRECGPSLKWFSDYGLCSLQR